MHCGGSEMSDYNDNFDITVENITLYPFHIKKSLRVIYVIKGSIKLIVVSGEWVLKENDIEIININEPIRIQGITDDNLIVVLSVDSQFAKKCDNEIDKYTYNCNCTAFFKSIANSRKQQILKKKLYNICESYIEENHKDTICDLLKDMVAFIGGQFNDIKNIFTNYPNNDLHMLRFIGINDYLAGNFNKKITLSELANIKYLSPQYLSGEFSSKLSRSFHSIVDYYRIIESVRLLIKTDLTITAISQECGFSAARYFYRHFKHFMNCTPTEFKKELNSSFIITERRSIKSDNLWGEVAKLWAKNEGHPDFISILINLEEKASMQMPFNIKAARMMLGRKSISIGKGNKESNEIGHKSYDTNVFAAVILKRILSGADITGEIVTEDEKCSTFLSGQKGIYAHNKIKKPLYWAIKFISELGEEVIDISDNYIITRKNDNMIAIIALNCDIKDPDKVISRYDNNELGSFLNVNIKLTNLKYQDYTMNIEKVDNISGSLLKHWESINKPDEISLNQRNIINRYIHPNLSVEIINATKDKVCIRLAPYSFALITVEPR